MKNFLVPCFLFVFIANLTFAGDLVLICEDHLNDEDSYIEGADTGLEDGSGSVVFVDNISYEEDVAAVYQAHKVSARKNGEKYLITVELVTTDNTLVKAYSELVEITEEVYIDTASDILSNTSSGESAVCTIRD